MKGAAGIAFAAVVLVSAPGAGRAQGAADAPQASLDATFAASLDGFQEVPSISTPATGKITIQTSGDGASAQIQYQLTYSGFPTAPTVAHIHFAQPGVAGAISAFLCGGGNKPACPAQGTVTGTIVAADVTGPEARGIAAGEIQELVDAMDAGFTYANVHSTQYPDGEIRGQIEKPQTGIGSGR
jgi:hypothetical protein